MSIVFQGTAARRAQMLIALTIAVAAVLVLAPLAQADRAFVTRFSTNDTGAIISAANTLETCPANASGCLAAQATGDDDTGNANLNNNVFVMQRVNQDATSGLIDSSSAQLNIPTGATVLFAGLYYGADASAGADGSAAPNPSAENKVSIKAPGATSYTQLTASVLDTSASEAARYQGFVDVTSLVAAAGAGTYTVGGVQEGTGEDHYGAWSIVVAYHLDTDPARNLTVDDGFVTENAGGGPVTIPVAGFKTPPSGTVNTNLGFISYEGDQGFVGDSATLDGHTLSDAAHPANNFFDSEIANDGVPVTTKSPNYVNQLGYDSSFINAAGLLPNSATSATIVVTTNGDAYYPGVVTFQTDLYAPKITQNKTFSDLTHPGGPVQEGDVLQYEISGTNTGQDGTSNFTLNDPIPGNTTYVPGSMKIVNSSGGPTGTMSDASGDDEAEYAPSSNSVTFRLGLGAGKTTGGNIVASTGAYEVTFDVKVNGPASNPVPPDSAVNNTATATFLSQSLNIPLSAVSSANTTVTAPDLQITKTLTSPSPVTAGTTATYSLAVDNVGDAPTQGTVSVTDNLPAGETLAAPLPGTSKWTCTGAVGATSTTCTRADALPGGQNYEPIVITTKVEAGATGNLSNTATVSGGGDGNLANNSSTDTVPSQAVADVALTKTAGNGTINVGGQDTFTLTATNNGPSAATSVAITDPIPNGFEYVSSTQPNGAACTIDPSTGTVVCQIGTLASGASEDATITVEALPSAATQSLTNTASVAAQQTDPNPANNTASATVNVTGADMSVVKTVDGNPTQLGTGSAVGYTIVATNNGPSDTTGAVVSDALPTNLGNVNATTTAGSCAVTAGTLLCTDPTLAAGGSFTVHVSGTVISAGAGASLDNTASATSAVPDPDMSNNSSSVSTPLSAQADLSVSKTATPDPATPGTNETFSIVTTNSGPDTASAAQVVDPLPSSLTFVSASTGCTNNAGTVTCALGDLASGASKTVTVVTTVSASATGTLTNTATASSTTPDPDPSNNSGSSTTGIASTDDDAITKTVDNPDPGQGTNVTYTLTATNSGPATSTGTTVSDTLPAGVTYVSDDGGCTLAASTLTCPIGNLASGASEQIHVVGSVVSPVDDHPGQTLPIGVQKIEDSFSLQGNQEQTYTITCPTGYWMTDGSAQVDAVDQGTGTLASAEVLSSYEEGKMNFVATILNAASGQAQGHLTGVCLSDMTGPGAQTGNPEDLVESDPVIANETWQAGEHTVTLSCGPGQTAIDPGFLFDSYATVRGSQQSADGTSITFTVDVPESVDAQLLIRCLNNAVTDDAGRVNNLQFTTASNTVSVPPSSGSGFTSVQATCPTGYEGIVASYILDPGLLMLGTDPQPITRVFFIYNPTNQTLNATVSLLCVALNTGPEEAQATVTNTASISSTTEDSNLANNSASATFMTNGIAAPNGNPVPATAGASSGSSGLAGSSAGSSGSPAGSSGSAGAHSGSSSSSGSAGGATSNGKAAVNPVTVSSQVATLVRTAKGTTLKVTLACFAASSCSGAAAIQTLTGLTVAGSKLSAATLLGSVKYKIAAGHKLTLEIPVATKYVKYLSAARKLKLTLKASHAGIASRTTQLKLARVRLTFAV